jgi:chromosome segregation ATPase
MADRKVIIGLQVDTGRSKQNLEEVRHAAEQFGSEGAKAANHLAAALENIEKAEEQLTRKISQGRLVTEKDGKAMIQQFEILRNTITETFGSIENAPAEIQEAFRKAEGSLDRTTSKVRDLSDAVDDQKGTLKEGGEQWTGLGDAIGKAAGPMGAVVAKAGLISAAFKEGVGIGMQLNKLFGTDMSLWDEAIDRLGKKAGIVVRGMADSVVELGGVLKEVFTPGEGWGERISAAYASFDKASGDLIDKVKNLDEALKKEEESHRAVAAAAEAAKEAEERAKDAAEKLAAEKKKLREEIDGVTKSLQEENLELEKQKILATDSEHAAINLSSQAAYYKRQVDEVSKAIAAQRDELRQLTARYGENDPVVRQAQERLALLEQSLASSRERYTEATEETRRYEQQQKAAEQAAAKLQEKIDQASDSLRKQQEQLATLGTATQQTTAQTQQATTAAGSSATAIDSQGQAAEKTKTEVVMYRDELGKVHIETRKVADTTAEATKGVTAVGDAAEKAATPAKALAQSMETLQAALKPSNVNESIQAFQDLDAVLASIAGHVKEIATNAPAAANALKRMSESGMEESASGGGAGGGF